jgi:thioredoxin 2
LIKVDFSPTSVKHFGPCKAMAPDYERVASEFEPAVRFLKVDTEAEPELAARYNIRSIPTLMLFRKGNIVAQQAGALDAQTLRSWLRRHTASFSSAFQTDSHSSKSVS